MRRRGRAQDSTEGPDGPRLGYAASREVMAWGLREHEAFWASFRETRTTELLSALAAWRRQLMPDAVRSGRERLGE